MHSISNFYRSCFLFGAAAGREAVPVLLVRSGYGVLGARGPRSLLFDFRRARAGQIALGGPDCGVVWAQNRAGCGVASGCNILASAGIPNRKSA